MSFNKFVAPSDRVNEHVQQATESWWTQFALPGRPHSDFYSAVAIQDELRFSREKREIPVFTDQRFGAIKPTRGAVGLEE